MQGLQYLRVIKTHKKKADIHHRMDLQFTAPASTSRLKLRVVVAYAQTFWGEDAAPKVIHANVVFLFCYIVVFLFCYIGVLWEW